MIEALQTGLGAATAGALIAAAIGAGTALVLTRTGKEKRRDLKAEIETQEKNLEGLHRQANDLRRETAELTTMKAEADQIRSEYASLGERQAELRAWAREEVLELDKVEAKRRAAAGVEAELARSQAELGTLQDRKNELDHEIEEAHKRHREAEAVASNAEQKERELAEALAGQHKEIERKREQPAGLEGRRDELADQIRTAESRIEELKDEERSLKTRRDMLDEDLDRLRGAVGTVGGDGTDGAERLGNLEEPPHLWFPDAASPASRIEEGDTLDRAVDAISGQGLNFPRRVVDRFHTALKVSRISPLTVLAGISGTGKTQLPRAYARAMGMECLVVPVQPRWDGPRDLLGHFDFLHRRFQATELARLLYNYTHTERVEEGETGQYKLKEADGRMAIVLLDEMNLARTEYYFSEFLSRLELQGKADEEPGAVIEKDRMVELDVPYLEEKGAVQVFPTQRVLWVGTMNEDESTMTLSDKVIDRANILRFARPTDMRDGAPLTPATEESRREKQLSASAWNQWCAIDRDLGQTIDLLATVNEKVMEPCGRSFGHRMRQAMVKYVNVYTGRSWEEGFADQVEMRLLPKLQGVDAQMDQAGDAIRQLAGMCEETLKDADLATSIQQAQVDMQQTGTFNWKGRELSASRRAS